MRCSYCFFFIDILMRSIFSIRILRTEYFAIHRCCMKYVVVVECAIQKGDEFLFIKRPEGVHAGGLLSFPGGKVECKDGSAERNILLEAVKREILEEVGLELRDPIQFVTSSYFLDSYRDPILDVIFYCNMKNAPSATPSLLREFSEYYWLTLDEAFAHPLASPWLKRYLTVVVQK